MNRKLKILKLKHDYLKLELEDVKDDFKRFNKDFDKYFDKYYEESTKLKNQKNQSEFENPSHHFEKMQEKNERDNRKEIDEQRNLLKNAPRKVKNLYKRLAKTHPDKLGGKHEKFQSVKGENMKNKIYQKCYNWQQNMM